jgi:hypothetical protein
MKKYNKHKTVLAVFAALVFSFSAINVEAEVDYSSYSYEQLVDTRSALIKEQRELSVLKDNTQSPSQVKSIDSRLAEISSELSFVQKSLIALAGAAALLSLGDDKFDDNYPPVITLNGSNPMTVELGSTFTDPGATAMDANHGSTPVTSSGTVNTDVVGSYTITYTATDLDNNTATATRVVNVVDTIAPVVTVTGDNPATVELGATYTDAGATASDASNSATVITSGSVDTDKVGTYTLTYTATDASGNAGTATRTVNVVDTVAPVITSPSVFIIDENVTSIGTATATDLDTVTFTVGATTGPGNLQSFADNPVIQVSAAGALTFDIAPDYDMQVPDEWPNARLKDKAANPKTLSGYRTGATMDFSATITATDASGNAVTQDIIVQVRDVGGADDDTGTGTGTGVGTSTGESAAIATGTST